MDTIQALLQGNGILSRDPWQPTTPLYHLFIFHSAVLPERPEGGEHKQIQSMCVGKPTWLRKEDVWKTCGNSAGLVFSPRSASYSDQNLTDVMLAKVPVSRGWKLWAADQRPGRAETFRPHIGHSQSGQQLVEVDSQSFSTDSDPGLTWV